MTGGEIAAMIGGLTGFIATMYTTWRVARADRMKHGSDSAAVLLGGWQSFQAETLKEVDRVRKSCQEEIAKLKEEHSAERFVWQVERERMQNEIDDLKEQVMLLIQSKTRGEKQ